MFSKIREANITRKESSGRGMRIAPTDVFPSVILDGEDYALKVSINEKISPEYSESAGLPYWVHLPSTASSSQGFTPRRNICVLTSESKWLKPANGIHPINFSLSNNTREIVPFFSTPRD